jgi:hypothetical protein
MASLLKFENYKLIITPEALTLKVYAKIWNRDRSIHKERANRDLAFVYFMADASSTFQSITDTEDRQALIIKE